MRSRTLTIAGIAALILAFASTRAAAEAPPAPAKPAIWTFELGDPLPKGNLIDLAGNPFPLPPDSSAPIVVNIFASWCGPCRMEMPLLEKEIWQAYRDRGVLVLGIDRGEPLEVVETYLRQVPVTYPILLDRDKSFFRALSANGQGIPKTLLLDRTGRVRWRENGFFPGETLKDLKRELETLLGDASANEKLPKASPVTASAKGSGSG